MRTNIFKKKEVSLQPAIQKYDAIDSIVKNGAIKVNRAQCKVEIIKELWDIYPEVKKESVLRNILFYINFGNAAEQKKSDNVQLHFSVTGTHIKGVYNDDKKINKGIIVYDNM